VDGDKLKYTITKQPTNGTLSGKAPNLTYTPNKDYNGEDSFSFIANDSKIDSNETTVNLSITPVADLVSLKLNIDNKNLNIDTNTTYTLTPTYDEGEIPQELVQKISNPNWIENIANAVYVDNNNHLLFASIDGNITIQAKIDNIVSNTISLDIYWEVNGHRLPPMPDEKKNNETLLGIDSNSNGVRDDVERWIYERYKDKHPIYAALAMDSAQADQEALKGSTHYEKAHNMSSDVIDCEGYYKYFADMNGEQKIIDEYDRVAGREVLSRTVNNKDRVKAYVAYDHSLSGGVYDSPRTLEDRKNLCSKKVLEVVK